MFFSFQENVEFVLNAPYPDVLNWLSRAYAGLNTMVDEHFGINVVEYMVRVCVLFLPIPGMRE